MNCHKIRIERGVDLQSQFQKIQFLPLSIFQMMDRERERKRDDIIIELGYEDTKVGTSYDKLPRKTLKCYGLFEHQQLTPAWEAKLEQFLHKIFFFEIYYSPNDKTVVLLQTIYMNRRILAAIAKILFNKFEISKLEFSLSSVSPLYCTAKYTGIVVSASHKSTDILGVYESYPLIQESQSVPVGYETINLNLKQQLLQNLPQFKGQSQNIKPELLFEVRNHSSVPPREEPITVTVDKVKLKIHPKWINYECYFRDPEEEEPNIAYSFLKMINQIKDVDVIKGVCKNVVFSGDLWNVKGFKNLFKKRVSEYLNGDKFPRLKRLDVANLLGFPKLPFNCSVLAWVGSTIASSVSNIEHLTLRKNEYQSQGFNEKIFQRYFLG